MVRHYKKRANRGMRGDGKLQDALCLAKDGMSLIRVSKELGVLARTVRRYRDDQKLTSSLQSSRIYSMATITYRPRCGIWTKLGLLHVHQPGKVVASKGSAR